MKEICLGKISLTDEELNWFQAGYNEAFRASLKIINKEFNKK